MFHHTTNRHNKHHKTEKNNINYTDTHHHAIDTNHNYNDNTKNAIFRITILICMSIPTAILVNITMIIVVTSTTIRLPSS